MRSADQCWKAFSQEMLLSFGLKFTAYLSLRLFLQLHIIANNIASAAMHACTVAQYLSAQIGDGYAEHAVTTFVKGTCCDYHNFHNSL